MDRRDEIPPAEEEHFVFRGKARFSRHGLGSTEIYRPVYVEPQRPHSSVPVGLERRQSLPEVRELRLRRLNSTEKTSKNKSRTVSRRTSHASTPTMPSVMLRFMSIFQDLLFSRPPTGRRGVQ